MTRHATTLTIDVVTPVLKKLQLNLHASWNWNNIGVSVTTPMAEEVSWKCSYPRLAFSVGFWSLESLAIETTERYIDTGNDTCSPVQKLSRFHVLRLRISSTHVRLLSVLLNVLDLRAKILCTILLTGKLYCSQKHLGAQLNFAQEIQKLPVIIFPVLDLYLYRLATSMEHL